MTIIIETERLEYLEKLESLRRVFIGVKMLYACTIPSNEFEIHDSYFHLLNTETKKMIVGKLYILLSDEYKNKKNNYNTISFKLLLNGIIDGYAVHKNFRKRVQKLIVLRKEIDAIDEKYKTFRDKFFAHIELDDNHSLRKISDLGISNKDITYLLELAQKAYDQLFLFLDNASCDHMRSEIESLSEKLWRSYEKIGLVKRTQKMTEA